MKDLQSPGLIYLKAFLFLALGLAGAVLLWLESPALKTVLLLALAIWSFCRAYYFAFYVVEHYLDPGFRYSGLWSFVRYLLTKKRSQ
ncbi:MAG: hypothetical protein JWM16_1054 [Verrucomicrobiales bacterium]|nr:hypothetical protein [Verrucomicrobiales bacterium]